MATVKKGTPALNLHDELTAKRAAYIETKRSHAAGELVNPRALGRIRKEIARIQTELHKKEEGAPAIAADAPKEEEEKK